MRDDDRNAGQCEYTTARVMGTSTAYYYLRAHELEQRLQFAACTYAAPSAGSGLCSANDSLFTLLTEGR